jgi:hypothetical protein
VYLAKIQNSLGPVVAIFFAAQILVQYQYGLEVPLNGPNGQCPFLEQPLRSRFS